MVYILTLAHGTVQSQKFKVPTFTSNLRAVEDWLDKESDKTSCILWPSVSIKQWHQHLQASRRGDDAKAGVTVEVTLCTDSTLTRLLQAARRRPAGPEPEAASCVPRVVLYSIQAAPSASGAGTGAGDGAADGAAASLSGTVGAHLVLSQFVLISKSTGSVSADTSVSGLARSRT
jgi:hypothetical protein